VEHSGPVNAVLVTPDGSQIVSASDDSTIRIWDRTTEQLVHELTGHTTRVLALPSPRWLPDSFVKQRRHRPRLGPLHRQGSRRARGGYEGEVNAVLVSPDGSEIIGGYDGKVIVWNR